MVDPKVKQVADEGARAEPQQEELLGDDLLPERSSGRADIGVQGEEDLESLNISRSNLVRDAI